MSPQSTSMSSGSLKGGGFQFGIRRQESSTGSAVGVNSPLKVSKDSHRIRKPPLPLPQVQYRPPIIIHTYSPKVIHTQPDDFMLLVQKLTGSSDTRLRLKKSPSSKKANSAITPAPSDHSLSAAVANLERQGSSATANCGSPSTSEDSSFLVPSDGEAATMKQSTSPRSPLDSHFEFDNVSESMVSHFDASSMFASQQVKAEPSFAFNDSNSFTFFGDFMQPSGISRALPPHSHLGTVKDPIQSSGFIASNLMNYGLPDLSPAWSQSFLDCHGGPALGYQAPFPRQRFSGGYAPSTPESSTMVALENIHAFMLA